MMKSSLLLAICLSPCLTACAEWNFRAQGPQLPDEVVTAIQKYQIDDLACRPHPASDVVEEVSKSQLSCSAHVESHSMSPAPPIYAEVGPFDRIASFEVRIESGKAIVVGDFEGFDPDSRTAYLVAAISGVLGARALQIRPAAAPAHVRIRPAE